MGGEDWRESIKSWDPEEVPYALPSLGCILGVEAKGMIDTPEKLEGFGYRRCLILLSSWNLRGDKPPQLILHWSEAEVRRGNGYAGCLGQWPTAAS